MTERPRSSAHWMLDRRIPVVLILSVLSQAVYMSWVLRGQFESIHQNTQAISENQAYIATMRITMSSQLTRSARIDERMKNIDRLQQQILRQVTIMANERKKQ